MKIFSILLTFILASFATIFSSACANIEYKASQNPQTFMGSIRYVDTFFQVGKKDDPYKYAFYDINGTFVCYVNFSKVITPSLDKLINRNVVLRGVLTESKDGKILNVDFIKLNR